MSHYSRLARYYDLIQSRLVDYQGEVELMDELFRHHGVRTILDMACGTGEHVLKLAQRGYHCVGMDVTPEMIEVAAQKSRNRRLAAKFLTGDLRDYQLASTFDAAVGLYAFTTLVSDKEFRAGLASARRAVRDGGLFYFNLLNAEYEGAALAQCAQSSPGLYLDVVASTPDARLVRFNQSQFDGEIQTWKTVTLIDEGKGVTMVPGTDRLRFHHLTWAQEELSRAGFRLLSVRYADVEGFKRWDMFIVAQADKRGGEYA